MGLDLLALGAVVCDHRLMWGDALAVSNLRCDVLAEQRKRLKLTKAETARQMFAYLAAQGAGARDGIALTDTGFAWATESSCRRAIDDLEGGKRFVKEVQYVDSLLVVLGLRRRDVGLED
ncbi:MAG: hypothetical protein WAN93_11620 [Solirubrobacteraceae bacterium]